MNSSNGSCTLPNKDREMEIASVEEALKKLQAKARPDRIEGMSRFGIAAEKRLGLSVPDMRQIAKELGKNHKLALALWKTGIPEAKIVAAMIDEPEKLTESQMEGWVIGFDSWDVCDQVCMNLFERTDLAWQKVLDWSERDEEYVRRAAFALIACLAWHDRDAEDGRFISLLPFIKRAATDERNYVKKAVNWALRNIGKRNPKLNKAAIRAAREIQKVDSKAARWIAADAIRELTSEAVRKRSQRR
jgi:3-methyladenine DNA glycosylase AlkD